QPPQTFPHPITTPRQHTPPPQALCLIPNLVPLFPFLVYHWRHYKKEEQKAFVSAVRRNTTQVTCVHPPPQFLLIAGNECESESHVIPDSGFFHIEDTSPEHTEIPTANEFQTPHFLALSDATYFGLKSPRAVRVTGYIQGQPVAVLVDCDSTHNIIQPRIASLLTMAPTKINPFPVMVGNGQFLECNSLLPSTPLDINKTQFHGPLFVIPVAGADV
nr:hypothetical protein [Tanacetum cinerariifolium]